MVDPPPPPQTKIIKCSHCGLDSTQVSFSKTQRKKANKQQGVALCTSCNEAGNKTKTPTPTTPSPLATATSTVDANTSSQETNEEKTADTTTINADTPLDPTSPDLQEPIPRKKRKISHSFFFDDEAMSDGNHKDDDDDDEHSSSHSDEGEHEVSIAAIKREVLGRDDLHVETPIKENETSLDHDLEQIRKLTFHSTASTISLAERLHSDMLCAICQDIHYPPISLYCGHSFCQDCLEWWDKTSPTCPTCRAEIGGGGRSTKFPQINGSLKQCLLGLYPKQVEQKLQSQKMTILGEHGGQHSRGFAVLSPLQDEFWHAIATTPAIKVRRNIVLDDQDQRMQLAMGLYQVPTPLANGIIVPLCLLTMEEDEANDSGFPIVVSKHVEDEQFLCTNENRFRQSLLLVEMIKEDGSMAPLARIAMQAMTMKLPGFVEYVLDSSNGVFHAAEARVLRFHHDDTGAILELDLSLLQEGASGATFASLDQRQRQQQQQQQQHRRRQQDAMVMEQLDDEDDEDGEEVMERSHDGDDDNDDDEEDGHDLDEFEEDSFVVQEEEETSDKEGEFSGNDDDDDDNEEGCVYCKDGGELMVCDGGAEMDGCGKSFHYQCVNLPAIPEGDWICSDCAKEGGYTVDGRRGHEFVVQPTNYEGTQKKRVLDDDDHDSSSSDEENPTNKAKEAEPANDHGMQKKRFLDDDHDSSSSDEENPTIKAKKAEDKHDGDAPASKNAKSSSNNNKPSKRRIVLEDTDEED